MQAASASGPIPGLHLEGELVDGSLAVGWLRRAQPWLHESWGHTLMGTEIADDEGAEQLRFQLHPASSDVVVRCLGRSRLRLDAETYAVGPGYHAHLCELAGALADELGVEWAPNGDDSGFFEHHSTPTLERAITTWLGEAATRLLTYVQTSGWRGARLGLTADHEYPLGEAVTTALGPRDRPWLELASRDPQAALDVFPWWEASVGAGYCRGRALVELWTQIRWRPPITDEEVALMESVLRLLGQAYASNPRLEYPWAEWGEVSGFVSRESSVPARPTPVVERPRIGYRRGPVRVKLGGGWSIEVPGAFAERRDDADTFTAWDGNRAITVTTSRLPAGLPLVEAVQPSEGVPPDAELVSIGPACTAEARAFEVYEEGGPVWKLEARLAIPSELVLITLLLGSRADWEWACATLNGVEPPPG